MTPKAHKQIFATPQSPDNPPNFFMLMFFSFPEGGFRGLQVMITADLGAHSMNSRFESSRVGSHWQTKGRGKEKRPLVLNLSWAGSRFMFPLQ